MSAATVTYKCRILSPSSSTAPVTGGQVARLSRCTLTTSGSSFTMVCTGREQSTPCWSSCTSVRTLAGTVLTPSFNRGSSTVFTWDDMAVMRGASICLEMTVSKHTMAPFRDRVSTPRVCSSTPSEGSPPSPPLDDTCRGVFPNASLSCTSSPSSCALCSWGAVRVTVPTGMGAPGRAIRILWTSGAKEIMPSTLLTICESSRVKSSQIEGLQCVTNRQQWMGIPFIAFLPMLPLRESQHYLVEGRYA